jgi:hypothetical protein
MSPEQSTITIESAGHNTLLEQPTQNDIILIFSRLSDDQKKSIENHKLDINVIKGLQAKRKYPPEDTFQHDFKGSIFVGIFKNETGQMNNVFLKRNGWFTTDEYYDCDPFKNNDVPVYDDNGYKFGKVWEMKVGEALISSAKTVLSKAGKNRTKRRLKMKRRNNKSRKI